MLRNIRTWLLLKLIGDTPIIANLPFPITIVQGEYKTERTILIKNSTFS